MFVIITEKIMPYRCAFYRKLSEYVNNELTVLFLDSWGLEKRFDPTFNTDYSWSPEVLNGFPYEVLENYRIFNTTYTGADKTKFEIRMGVIGNVIFFIRTYFGYINLRILKKLKYLGTSHIIIIETYSSVSCLLSILYTKIIGNKIYLRGEMSPNYNQSSLKKGLKFIYLRTLFLFFDGFIYSNDRSKKYMHNYTKNPNFVFVPSSVEDNFVSELDSKTILTKYNLSFNSEDRVFLGVGRLVERKNWLELIKGFQYAYILNNKIKLILVGDGPERKILEDYIKNNGLDNAITFVGFKDQEEVKNFYKISHCVIQTSYFDPSPKVLNEAIKNSLPLIVSDTVGLAGEICIHEYNGFVYSLGSYRELGDHIFNISINDELRSKFISNSNLLSQKWSLDTGVTNLLKHFEIDIKRDS